MGLILDTSAIIHLERHPGCVSNLTFSQEQLVLPTIVWAEVLIGVRMAENAQRAAQRRGLLERIRLMTDLEPFTAPAAEIYADIYCWLRSKGRTIPQNDLQVASIALNLGYGVLIGPNDERHFRQIKRLRIEVLPNS